MYIVFVLAIRDGDAVAANTAAPIEEIISQQVGPVVTRIVVAVALTNLLACILANILVASRLTYSMARDNMLPFSNVWRHVSPRRRSPTFVVLGALAPSLIFSRNANPDANTFRLLLAIDEAWLLHGASSRERE